MRTSNYDLMRDAMQTKFLDYDQQTMIDRFHLKYDPDYLYIRFVGRDYRIDRHTGRVEWHGNDGPVLANYNEAMSIFDVLCASRVGCHLSGRFLPLHQLRGVVQSAAPGGNLYARWVALFDRNLDGFCRACEALGGIRDGVGDASYRLAVFDFLPVILQFWQSDEEFPPNLSVLWDENLLDFIHYETAHFILGHMLSRIGDWIGGHDHDL